MIQELTKYDKNFETEMSLFMKQQIKKMNSEKIEKQVKKKVKSEKK
jgi:hypothetical protein